MCVSHRKDHAPSMKPMFYEWYRKMGKVSVCLKKTRVSIVHEKEDGEEENTPRKAGKVQNMFFLLEMQRPK